MIQHAPNSTEGRESTASSSARLEVSEDQSTEDDPYRTSTQFESNPQAFGSRFRILRNHARGGLGIVYVALDTELNREVALKQLLDHHADSPTSRSRFVLEAEVTGGLEHPGIVPVYGLGQFEDGRPYYAMRFIRGDTFKETIAKFHSDPALKRDPAARSLRFQKLLRTLLDTCNAVDYAHGRGVIHRDLKPSNILVGKHGETLVVDWGLAKAVGRKDDTPSDERTLVPGSVSGSSETLPGSALGTPAYMSPEQSLGDLDRITSSTDVYSLGATLYHLLTGKPPFDGDVANLLKAVQAGDFPTPRSVDETIPSALEAVCLKAMARQPSDRYESARALGEDIERWMADQPVLARPEPVTERIRRTMSRHRTLMTAAAVALIASMIGLGSILIIKSQSNYELSLKIQLLDQANAILKTTGADLVAKNGQLEAARELESKKSRELAASIEREQLRFGWVIKSIKTYRRHIENDPLFEQPIFGKLKEEIYPDAVKLYADLAEQLAVEKTDRSRRQLALVQYDLGELCFRYGRPQDALTNHRRSLELRRELSQGQTVDHENQYELARSLVMVGYLQLNQPVDFAPPTPPAPPGLSPPRPPDEPEFAKAQRSREEKEELEEFEAKKLSYKAELERYEAKILELHKSIIPQSKPYFEQAQSILKNVTHSEPAHQPYRVLLSWCLEEMGGLELICQNRSEAIELYSEARAIREGLIQDDPKNTAFRMDFARNHEQIANVLMNLGPPLRVDEVLKNLEKAVSIHQSIHQDKPEDLGNLQALTSCYQRLALARERLGRKVEAELARKLANEALTASKMIASPYESTANPGTYANNTLPPSAYQSGQGVNPPQPAIGQGLLLGQQTPSPKAEPDSVRMISPPQAVPNPTFPPAFVRSANGSGGISGSGLGGIPTSGSSYFSMIGD